MLFLIFGSAAFFHELLIKMVIVRSKSIFDVSLLPPAGTDAAARDPEKFDEVLIVAYIIVGDGEETLVDACKAGSSLAGEVG